MAIGKVDAYATVQAPNVDFGDIGINAQKFQADMADKIVKQREAKKTPPDKINDVGNFIPGGYSISDMSQRKDLQKVVDNQAFIYKKGQEVGGIGNLPIELQLEYAKGEKAAETFNEIAKQTGANIKEFLANKDKASSVNDGLYDVVSSTIDNPNDVEHQFVNGSWEHKIPEIETKTDANGNVTRELKKDGNGQQIYKTWYDSQGNKRNSFTEADIQSKAVFRTIPKVDLVGDVNSSRRIIFGDIIESANSQVKISNRYYDTPRVQQAVQTIINTKLKDRATKIELLAGAWTKVKNDPNATPEQRAKYERYSHPMREDEYTKEDMAIAGEQYKRLLLGSEYKEHKVSVNTSYASITNKDKQNAPVVARVEQPVLGILNPAIKDIANGSRSVNGRQAFILGGNLGAKYALTDKNKNIIAGDDVKLIGGSKVQQYTIGIGGVPLVKVGMLDASSSSYGVNQLQQMMQQFASDNPDATADEMQLNAEKLGATYTDNWVTITDAAFGQLGLGSWQKKKAEILKGQPKKGGKSSTTGGASKWNK